MRILLCSNRYFVSGGPERYLFTIAEILEARGHTVVPFAMDFERNEPTPYSTYFVSHPVDRRAVYYRDMSLTTRQKLKLLAKTLYNFEARTKVQQAIRAARIDLVYALQVSNYLSPAIIDGAHRLGVPIVERQSDFHILCPAYHFFRDGRPCEDCRRGLRMALKHRCMRRSASVTAARVVGMKIERMLGTYRKIQRIVTPTQFLRRKLVEFGYPAAKIACIPTPIDAAAIEPRYEPGEYLLYTGNLNPHKGVRILVEAMRQLPDVRLKIAGKASQEGGDVMAAIEQLGLENVELVGFQAGDALADLYRGAAGVVAPALWYENMPNAVLEAMAYGKPIVASDIGSMGELITHGVNGLLAEPGNAEDLAAKIAALLADRTRLSQMGMACRERVLRDHGAARHYDGLTAVFDACLASASC